MVCVCVLCFWYKVISFDLCVCVCVCVCKRCVVERMKVERSSSADSVDSRIRFLNF